MVLQRKEIPIKLLLIYIMIQPFLDAVTGITLQFSDSQLTVSLIVRLLFFVVGGFYILFIKENPYRRKYFLYLAVFCLFFIVQLSLNSYLKPQFHLLAEIKFILKTMYFILILLLVWFLFKVNERSAIQTLQIFVFSITIYSFLIVLAGLTGTAFQSYEFEKVGQVGWFHAGNEIGAILSVGAPIVLLFALKKSPWYWISVLLTIYSLFLLGTKVGLGAIMLTLFVGLLTMIWEYLRKMKGSLSKIGILLALLICSIIYTPFSPVAKNINIHLINLETKHEKEDATQKQEEHAEQLQQLLLSGRHQYLNNHLQSFVEAPLLQKIVGMGYGGNYQTEAKMIEMDPFDLFFSFGILGTILFLLPIIYFVSIMFYCMLRRISLLSKAEYIFLFCGFTIGMGISFIAGHVLTAPSVSLYMAILLAIIAVKIENDFWS